jgi:hypothetical protein
VSPRAVALAHIASGCATATPPPREEPIGPELDSAIAEQAALDARAGVRAHALARSAPDRYRVRSLAPPRAPALPSGRRGRMNARFQNADLGEALRLLADAGGYQLVTDGELAGNVTLEMRRVDPYDALTVLAEAHGARVERRGRMVLVTKGERQSAKKP